MTATKKPAAKTPAKTTKAPAKKKAPVPKTPNTPKHQVVDDVFVWIDEEQGEVRIPLRFKTKLLRQINTMKDSDETEMLFGLLEGLGDEKSMEQIDEMDIFDTMDLVEAYFSEFEKKHEARMGESGRSSKS